MGRLQTNGVVTSTYSYDGNSNRNGGIIRGESTSATYDAQDRLTSYNSVAHTYNANGEILIKGSASLNYDVFGNLKTYTKVTYEIDPLQRRFGTIVGTALSSRLIYNPEGKVVGQLNNLNKLQKTFVYASKKHVPDYYIDASNKKFKIVTDYLGSVRLVVSSTGVISEVMEHDEFGRVLQDTSPGAIPFGFAGGLYDHRTGLVRFGARDYDPETGRWLSKDPIRFTAGDPNLYGYVLQDPINKIDPSGFADWWQVGRGFAGVIGGSAIAGGGVVAGAVVTGGSCALAAPAGIALGAGSVVAGGQLIYNGLTDIIGGFNAEPPPVPYSYPQ